MVDNAGKWVRVVAVVIVSWLVLGSAALLLISPG
jgi:hypothetical protein